MSIALNIGFSGVISDYSDLLDKTRLWLDRGTKLDALMPSFIALAESYMNRTLRTPEMEAIYNPVAITGAFTLPDDFLALRSLTAKGEPLQAMSPSTLAHAFGTLTGIPRGYAISGRSVKIAPLGTDALELAYWQRIPPLTLNSPTNWVLDLNSDLYLYGTLLSAETYIDNPSRIAQWQAAFEGAVDQLVRSSSKARWGGPIVARSGVVRVRGARA
jgi:hypothetical protein